LFAGLFLNALTYQAISALGSRVPRWLPRLSDRAFGILSGVIPSEERPTWIRRGPSSASRSPRHSDWQESSVAGRL